MAPLGDSFRRRVVRALDRTGTRELAKAVRDTCSPQTAARRRFHEWLAEADARDNARMRVAMVAALTPESNCIDVGAYTGDFFAEFHRIAPLGTHIAYEPLPKPCAELATRFPNADIRNCALSNFNGRTSFMHVVNSPAWSGFRSYDIQTPDPPRTEMLEVDAVRLDDDLPPNYQPHLIKVDVNGAEEQFLLGALGTLRRYKPMLFLEYGLPASHYGTTPEVIHRLLTVEAGMRIYDLDGSGPLSDGQLATAIDTKWNFLVRA